MPSAKQHDLYDQKYMKVVCIIVKPPIAECQDMPTVHLHVKLLDDSLKEFLLLNVIFTNFVHFC